MTRRQFLSAATFVKALPGYRYEFPRDHFSHPGFQTEWWYYTGNLNAGARPFGFELTFFRAGIAPPGEQKSIWTTHDAFIAHFALTDITGQHFLHSERLNRPGPGLAGVDAARQLIWNGNWSCYLTPASHHLKAVAEDFSIDLDLAVVKAPVTHGANGVSQKGPAPGQASHYISFPRLAAQGKLSVGRDTHQITGGSAWMDHEYFSSELDANLAGWDWFSIQLDNATELMLYRLRQKDGAASPFSAGTLIDAKGATTHLAAADIRLTPGRAWKSYPVEWQIEVPRLNLRLAARPRLDAQEIVSRHKLTPTYWEGAMTFEGTHRGTGYLEMTGYGDKVQFSRPDSSQK